MRTSEVLKHAKRYLAKDYSETCNTGKEKFICIAIYTAAAHTKRITDRDVERCRKIVESRLEGKETIESWLVTRGCIPEYSICDRAIKDRIQQHRHAWLDLLIAEFESKGDNK